MTRTVIPETGTSREATFEKMETYRAEDGDAAGARLFSLVYATRPDVLDVAKEAYTRFFSENALNPMTFPSLRRFETEVTGMALDLFHAPDGAAGSMTSGGSESLLLAVKTARDWARVERPQIKRPEMLLPVSAHPALLKAAHIVGVTPVIVPMSTTLAADLTAARALVTDDTILIVASAPQYPHGVMDPVRELAALALEKKILCHVDACIGGFFLPWLEKLGQPVPPFDFRVPGVTSISCDLHKYAYAAKGASLLLHRSRALRRHQHYAHADWPGGLFGSPSVLGTRPGGAIAAAWAVMNYLGASGYIDLTRRAMNATTRLIAGVRAIPGLCVLGEPIMSCFAIGRVDDDADAPDLYVLAERMHARGWRLDKQQAPVSLHLTVSPAHDAVADAFLADLEASACELRGSNEQPEGAAAMYGMLGSLPDRGVVREALLDFMDGMDAP